MVRGCPVCRKRMHVHGRRLGTRRSRTRIEAQAPTDARIRRATTMEERP